MVYVQDIEGKPLMPTTRYGKVRRLLKTKQAVVVNLCPFTIRLTYISDSYKQEITLGVDAGTKHVGISATTKSKELYASEVTLRSDIVELLSTRRELRRTRRLRLRYRKPRFDNRIKNKRTGWVAPSVKYKIDAHICAISNVYSILPISRIVIEVAQFDMQKIKNPDISGKEYQEGDQFGFWNVREYVLARDGHKCQYCKGKSKDHVLNVHHIESRKTGGNSPFNLITLCETCHKEYHKGNIKLKVKRSTSLRDAAAMGIMKWKLLDKLKSIYPNVSITFGYITKHNRIKYEIKKSHISDAFIISKNFEAKRLGYYFKEKLVRRHNRQIHKIKILKGGKKKMNQAPFKVFGFRLFDKVEFQGNKYFIYARRLSGYFNIRDANSENKKDVTYKKLTHIGHGLISVETE
jgi:5-methylcytosine-specific restriction endonuclease McrA